MANETYNYFVKTFGKVNSIDEALAKILKKGYGSYYNGKYTNKQSIDRIKKKQGINCTDSCQVFYNIAKALNYEVKCVHVQCTSGGHVRLKLKHAKNTSGKWIDRDPAAVLSKNNTTGVRAIWCPKGKLIDTDPKWFMQGV